MLTARSEVVDKIVGFRMGSDGYVTKPFKLKPLIRRVKAILRRAGRRDSEKDVVTSHGIEMDRLRHRATAGALSCG